MIRVPEEAYILALFPKPKSAPPRAPGSPTVPTELRAIALGLEVPSFWSRHQITQAFDAANTIWTREAEIEFTPVTILERAEGVPANEHEMWIHFLNKLVPKGRGIGVGFVYDLPDNEGGWGGGHTAVISRQKAAEGPSEFAGNLLAHELGHVLTEDPFHALAGNDPNNLMYGSRDPRVPNMGRLNQRQVGIAQQRATGI